MTVSSSSPPDKLGEIAGPIRCHACLGTYSLGFEGEGADRHPVALHSIPHCAAFDRIVTVIDAVQFSELCRKVERVRTLS